MISPEEFLAAQVMKGTVLVPPYPAVALRVQELLRNPNFSMVELSQLVASDPALALRVIAVANSAANRPAGGQIGSIEMAVSRVGVSQVAELALAAALAEGACADGPLVHFRFLAWRKSLASAFIAQELAQPRGQRRGEAFLIGLLADFGLAVGLATLEPAVAAGRVGSDLPPSVILGAAERFQRDVSRRIAEKWGLPDAYRHALVDEVERGEGIAAALARIGRDGSRIARMVETYPVVTDKLLISALSDSSERAKVLAFLPFLPGSIAALGPQTQMTARPRREAPTSISAAANSERSATSERERSSRAELADKNSARWLNVSIRKGTETFAATLGLITETSAMLVAQKALPPNWITEVTIEPPLGKETFWLRVEKVTPERSKVRMDVAPYGFDATRHERWKLLMERLAEAG